MEDTPKGARGRGRPRGRPARGARGTRGGRGASRGASASAASPTPAPEPEPTPTPASDTEMADAPPADATPAESAIETASSNAAPSSITNAMPAEPPRNESPATRGASSTRGVGRGAARGGRFVPRAIRRSALDREAIARDVQSKLEDQEKQNARLKKLVRGGSRGGRRARGGPVNFGAVIRGGGGGFGSNIQTSAAGRSGSFSTFGAAGGFGSTGGGGNRAAGGGDGGGVGFTYRKGMKIEDATSQFDHTSRATGPRMNTDSFAERVLQQPETDSKEKPIPLPMGIRRVDPEPAKASDALKEDEDEDEEKNEPVRISSDDSSEIEDVFHNDHEGMTDNGQAWPGASGPKIVKVEDEEFHEIDRLTQRLAMKPSKVEKQKALKKMDWEDRYHIEKMQTQRLLFGIDSDDEDDQEDTADLKESKELRETKPKRAPLIQDGELYIFQFPPVMPPLHVSRPAPVGPTKKSPVKDEPDEDVAMNDAPSHNSKAKPVDLTVKDEEVVEEQSAAGSGSGSKKKPKSAVSSTKMEDQPSGFLGKLNVHKSGRISLDYGGMLFDVEMAIPISHAREAVLIVDQGEKNPDKDGYHGTAYGMGRIAGKFNAVPHWSSVKPWNVDAKELPPWGCDSAPEGTTLEDYAHLLSKEPKKKIPPPSVEV